MASIAIADDTDIFLGLKGEGAGDVAPSNVFFILDTSTSMRKVPQSDPNGSFTKIEILKQAMADILRVKDFKDTLRNINIGFSTLYRPGGVIDYPLMPIDGIGFNGDIVRNEITDTVNGLSLIRGTPLPGAHYEGLSYILGKPVLFGTYARDNSDKIDTTERPIRLSHPESFDDTVTPTYNFEGAANHACTQNTIILLSDGRATNATSYEYMRENGSEIINDLPIDPDDGLPCKVPLRIQERCGRELAEYAFKRQDTADADASPIITHTIGFDIPDDHVAGTYLKDVAAAGGGTFQRVENKNDLIETFLSLARHVAEVTTSFTPPEVPVNAEDRLNSASEIFISMFDTDRKSSWSGNVKKFNICLPSDTGCVPGQYLGSDGQIATDNNGALLETNVGDVWDESADPSAAGVMSGGLASRISDWRSRNIYTWTATNYPTTVDTEADAATRGWSMYHVDYGREILNGGAEPILTNTDDIVGSVGRLRKRLYQRFGHCDAAGNIDSVCMDTLISFMLGAKTRDEQNEGVDSENRWPIADILHSEIVSIRYGTTATGEAINKIVFGTNDGALHVHDAKTGNEEFVIYPQEVLNELHALETAENSSKHIYGLDGSPTVRIRDIDNDSVIEPADGDFIHLFIGMRRGGSHYYAFNLTPDSPLTNHTDPIGDPELLWKISGTTDATDPLFRLGQTWSRPKYTRISYGTGAASSLKSVVVFGGGYDPEVEDVTGHFGPSSATGSSLGNAIYIVDADTGETIWWASSNYLASSGAAGLSVEDMHSSIVGDINLIDSNNDLITDRLYAADLSGQVWRVDLHPDVTDNTVGKLAAIGQSGDPNDATDNWNERKFFYEPDFIRVRDGRFGGQGQGSDSYDAIALVSGNRADPLDGSVNNRAYVFRDYLDDGIMLPRGSASPTNYPVCNPNSSSGCTVETGITNTGLYDISNEMIDAKSSSLSETVSQKLSDSNGYFFDLLSDGEIGFGKTQALAGKLYFSTYDSIGGPTVREEIVDGAKRCVVDIGRASLYTVDLITGNALISNTSNTTPQDRALFVGHHPVSNIVPTVLPSGQGNTILEATFQSGALLPADPYPTILDFYPTFWYQE